LIDCAFSFPLLGLPVFFFFFFSLSPRQGVMTKRKEGEPALPSPPPLFSQPYISSPFFFLRVLGKGGEVEFFPFFLFFFPFVLPFFSPSLLSFFFRPSARGEAEGAGQELNDGYSFSPPPLSPFSFPTCFGTPDRESKASDRFLPLLLCTDSPPPLFLFFSPLFFTRT